MINTSQLFSSKIVESTRQFSARLMYGTEKISGALRSVQTTSGACSEGDFTVGAVFSSYIEVVIDKCEEVLENKELLLQIGLYVDDETVEYVDMGYYTVIKPKTSAYSTNFTAVGRITSKLNKLFDVPEVLTLRNIANAITATTGVAIIFNGEVSDAVLAKDITGMTCREALSVIAATFGGFATEDNGGNIVVSKYNTDSKFSVDGDRMTTLPEFNNYDYELDGIKVVVSAASQDEDGNVIEEVAFTEGTPRLEVINEFMTEDLFETFVANTVGYKYRPGIVPMALGDPRLQPWDCLEVMDINDNVYVVPCLNIVHTFDGGLTTTITAPGESESESSSSTAGPITQQLDRINALLLTVQEAIIKRLKADEILTEDIKFATGEFTKYLKGVQILAEQIDVEGLFAKNIEATGSVKGLTFISEGTPNYEDLPPEFRGWLGLSKLIADAASLTITSGTEGETDFLEAVSTAFGTKYRAYLYEGSYGGIEEAILYVDGFGIKFMTRKYDETKFDNVPLFAVDFNGVSWKGSQLITRTELNEILDGILGGGSVVLEETDPTVPAWAKAPTKPKYTADEVGARPNTWTPSASDVGADPKGTAEGKVSEHNTNTESHNDIRLLIEGLTTRLNTLADSDDTTLDQMSEFVAYIKANRSLIESVTTNKVNVSDIINNLTTNVEDKPLAAAQGVAIKALIDALSQNISTLSMGKADKATTLAGYGITDGAKKNDVDALQTGFDNHTSDTNKHITAEERTAWNGKANQEDFAEHSEWTHQAVDEIVDAVIKHREDDTSHITAEERAAWEAKPNEEDIPTKYSDLEDDIGTVRTINYIAPDENGNINVEGGSGTESNAFNIIKSGALVWNGNTEGKSVVPNSEDPTSLSYVRVSSVVPTLEELQKGGTWATTGDDGVEYEETFTSDNIVDNGSVIDCCNSYILIAKEDNVQYTDGSGITCTLPLAGVYFIYFGDDGYTSRLTITDYTGFTKSILKMESLTLHQHDWYGKAVTGGNTVRGDETLQGKYVKVSDSVPTEAEINNGGVVRYYNVTDGEISDELITGYFPSDDYKVTVKDEGITINYDFEFLVIVSFDGSSSIGGLTFKGIDSPGVYFKQNGYSCVHSLTINGYTKFSYNVEKIPFELIPEGIGGGVKSWNELEDRPFGEITVYSDTLTWDGNTNGLYSVMDLFYHVSDAVPTLEDLQQGGSVIFGGNEIPFTTSDVVDLSSAGMGKDCILIMPNGIYVAGVALKSGATATVEGITVTFEKVGVYLLNNTEIGKYTSKLIINNYQFDTIKTKTLDLKYLPESHQFGETIGTLIDNQTITLSEGQALLEGFTLEENGVYTVVYNGTEYADLATNAVENEDGIIYVICNPSLGGGEDNGMPFIILTQNGMTALGDMSGSESCTITIKGKVIDTLDLKYLPESHQFGETTVTSDTLTWDGDMTGKLVVSADVGEGIIINFVQVSDVVPTVTELQQGGTETFSEGGTVNSMSFTSEQITDGDFIGLNATFIVKVDNVFFEGFGVTFPKAGIYFISAPAMETRTESFTINGYEGFKTIEIKYIDNKYLEPFHEGVTDTIVDTLTWDGDETGRYTESGGMFLISETVPTLDELRQGGEGTICAPAYGGMTETREYTLVDDYGVNIYGIKSGTGDYYAFVITEPNTIMGSYTYEKAGVYFCKNEAFYTSVLKINNFPGFAVTKSQTQLKMEYLPKDEIADYVISKLAVWEGGSY